MPGFIFHTILATFRIFNRHKLRTGLTLLGIVIGMAAVITIVSIGQGARSAVQDQVGTMGTNVIVIMPGTSAKGGVRGAQGSGVMLTVDDAEALKKQVMLLKDTCWGRRDPTSVVYQNRNWRLPVIGISPSCLSIRGWSFTNGGPISQAEMDGAATVAILGQTVAEMLYDVGEEPIGSTIRIKNVPFRVIGILAPKGQSPGGNDQDDIIFIPFTTAQRKVHGAAVYGVVEAISTATERQEEMPQAVEQIQEILRGRHRLQPGQADDFTIRTQLDVATLFEGTSRTLTMLIVAVASISLLIGGIGIMNILLVSVTERTKEIGVRLAVGAKRKHIVLQFLVEALTLSILGGIAGIGFGVLGAHVTTLLAGWPTLISKEAILLAGVCAVVVGLLSGVYPATKAASLKPIDALRYEGAG